MIESAKEAQADIITDFLNQITVEGILSAELELNTIANCHEGKYDTFRRGNHRRLKLTDQILKNIVSHSEVDKIKDLPEIFSKEKIEVCKVAPEESRSRRVVGYNRNV